MTSRPIGIYDSGIGGLTVLRELRKLLPHEDFIYFADTKNLPYGNKSQEQIVEFSRSIIHWFKESCDAKLVVAACHTSSALALDNLSNQFEIPLIGTIRPLLKNILNTPRHQRIGIIATEASAKSQTHATIFRNHGYNGDIHTVGCPDFVPLIESGHLDTESIRSAAKTYLDQFKDLNPDTLIFGCTHYPFIRPLIESLLPTTTHYIDPAEAMSKEVQRHLEISDTLQKRLTFGNVHFVCSSSPHTFEPKVHQFMGHGFGNIKCVDLSASFNKKTAAE